MCRCFTECLFICLLLTGPVSAQAIRAVPIGMEGAATEEPIEAIAADGENRVWAIFRRQGARLGLLQEGHWSVVTPGGFSPTLQALKLARLSDGSIACLWRDVANEDVHVLSRHTPQVHEIIASGPVKLEQPRLLALAEGGMLVTAAGRELLYVPKAGAQPEQITLEENVFLPPKKNDDGSIGTRFLPLHAVQDQRGVLWLWSPAMQPQEYNWRLRGLGKLVNRSLRLIQFSGIAPDLPISVVAPWKNNHLAIAVAGTGRFDFDDEKHHVTAFKGAGEEMKYVERIFTANKEWFFITTPRPTKTGVEVSKTFNAQLLISEEKFYDPQKRTSALLWSHDSKLEVRTWKLDNEPRFGWPDRPIVEAGQGFWTCVGGGLAFIPYDPKQSVQRIDWRNGLELTDPVELAKSGDSTLVVLDRGVGKARMLPLNQPPSAPVALRVEVLKTKSLLLEDALGRVWGRMADGTFQCWENGSWQVIKVPEQVTKMYQHAFIADSHEQGWLIPMREGTAAVCDFVTKEWFVFDSLQAALAARMHACDKLKLRDNPSLAPVTSTGTPCQIGFLREAGTLHHFDGHDWRQWSLVDLAGPDARVTSSLSFDGQQRLTVAISGYRWKLSQDGQWQRTEEAAEERGDVYHSEDSTPPPDCPVTKVSSMAYDRHGVCWLSDDQGKLWKSIHGRAVPLLQPDEPAPLSSGRHLYEVRADLNGNAFLRLKFGWHGDQYLAVRSRLPLPESVVTLREVNADTARVQFGKAAWHAWRIDGGAWSQATDQRECRLVGVLPGEHELEVMAYNADLTPGKGSAKLKITIQAADIAELDALIQRLGGDDLDASEAAARRLRSQGKGILSSLTQAREKAAERTRWWLDAVIQQIEAQPRTE